MQRVKRWNERPVRIISGSICGLLFLLLFVYYLQELFSVKKNRGCHDDCVFTFSETIPVGMEYRNYTFKFPETYDVWKDLINSANKSIHIASFYWTLRLGDVEKYPDAQKGHDIFNLLLQRGKSGIQIKIAQNLPKEISNNSDTFDLEKEHAAEVRSLDFKRLVGGGVLHTKFILVDEVSAYIGSANMDWRSLSQVKEVGVYIKNCSCIGADLSKIFRAYWYLAEHQVPEKWSDKFATDFDKNHPMEISLNREKMHTYLSSSPPAFCPNGRTVDLDAILNVISEAKKFIYISVMDYLPAQIYTENVTFWPFIDDSLRYAAINRAIEVKLLISKWDHTSKRQTKFLQSLASLNGTWPYVNIEIRWMSIPGTPDQKLIPYARVNHNKYMVTDKAAYVGTSNWIGDYFTNTAGVGVIITPQTEDVGIRDHLTGIFERDWNSEYASPLDV